MKNSGPRPFTLDQKLYTVIKEFKPQNNYRLGLTCSEIAEVLDCPLVLFLIGPVKDKDGSIKDVVNLQVLVKPVGARYIIRERETGAELEILLDTIARIATLVLVIGK